MNAWSLRTSAIALVAICGTSFGAATLEFIGDGIGVSDISADGRVLVGNTIADEAYEPWRWVQGDPQGWKRLGSATVPVLGTGAGAPNVSYDGTRVSATMLGGMGGESRMTPYATQGIWTLGLGWTELFPPMPPDGILLDNGYGSAWGLSGDGTTVTGFYWRSTQGGQFGSAHPCRSTIANGPMGLPTENNRSARVNASNFDGTVVAGWEARADGAWRPTAWRDGVRYLLTDTPILCMANAVNADGSVIVGSTYNYQAARSNPARWDWNGSEYVLTDLGVLPGTPQTSIASVWASAVTDDGSTIVGTNRNQNNGPFSLSRGFVWTQAGGMRDIVDVLADEGLAFPANFMVSSLVISADGSTIAGLGINLAETAFLHWRTFVIRFSPLSTCPGDVNGDGQTNAADFTALAGNFATGPGAARAAGDLTDDGFVNVADFTVLAADFGCSAAN